MLILSESEVRSLFTVPVAIESQRVAFTALARGEAVLPDKVMIDGPGDSVAFCYAAKMSPNAGAVSKFGSLNPANARRGIPSVHAVITVLDPDTGVPVAIMDGTAISELRTAAASAVAAESLAPRARRLAVIGTGVQALAHVSALAHVLDLESVTMWGPTPQRLAAAVAGAADRVDIPVVAALDAKSALAQADVVALCTSSLEPVIAAEWLCPGATVLSVGSFEPNRCEYGSDVLDMAAIHVIDHLDTSAAHAGPIVNGLHDGLITRRDLLSLGEILIGTTSIAARDGDVAIFTSVGLGLQDAASATAVLSGARSAGIGVFIDLGR